MSYTNQPDHKHLDRKLIGELLRKLAKAVVNSSPTAGTREEHAERLRSLAGSSLERRWLDAVESGGYRLPSDAQTLIQSAGTRPDFTYRDHHCAVYIDGPPHDYPDRQQRDQALTRQLEDMGYTVVRFRQPDTWQEVFDRYPNVFGKPL
jgi:very-short-patch-repair endonuclease